MATAYIVMVGQLRSAEQLAGQLQHALDSRVVIEQGQGAGSPERMTSMCRPRSSGRRAQVVAGTIRT